jgi:hypothetical protein
MERQSFLIRVTSKKSLAIFLHEKEGFFGFVKKASGGFK